MFALKKRNASSKFVKEMESLKHAYPIEFDTKMEMKEMGRLRLTKEMAGKVSMMGVAVPVKTQLWKAQPYVILDEFYPIIAKFRTQNSGRGNRDNSRELLAPGSVDGTVKVCQLCMDGLNDEVHLLTQCVALDNFRANYSLGDETLEEFLHSVNGGPDLKYRKLMDMAVGRKKRGGYTRMLTLGKLLKAIVEEADVIWFDKLAECMDI